MRLLIYLFFILAIVSARKIHLLSQEVDESIPERVPDGFRGIQIAILVNSALTNASSGISVFERTLYRHFSRAIQNKLIPNTIVYIDHNVTQSRGPRPRGFHLTFSIAKWNLSGDRFTCGARAILANIHMSIFGSSGVTEATLPGIRTINDYAKQRCLNAISQNLAPSIVSHLETRFQSGLI